MVSALLVDSLGWTDYGDRLSCGRRCKIDRLSTIDLVDVGDFHIDSLSLFRGCDGSSARRSCHGLNLFEG
jgi:hypothetical protein